MDNWIYFYGFQKREVIKIGRSGGGPTRRMEQMSRDELGNVHELEFLCGLKADPVNEPAIHRAFEKFKNGAKETFSAVPKVVDYVRWLRDQSFVAVPENEEGWKELPKVTADNWLPKPGREKPLPSGVMPGLFGWLDLPPRSLTKDDYYTSERIIEPARRALGGIDLDPASHVAANETVMASRIFTVNDNGLAQPWGGRVWCNPPFSDWDRWVTKIISEVNSGRVIAACVLVAMRTTTTLYFEPMLKRMDGMCIIHGRIPFTGPHAGQPDDGHAILYFGSEPERFEREFSTLGTCLFRSGRSQ